MKPVRDARCTWAGLSSHKRFEQLVAPWLAGVVGVLIVVAIWNLLLVIAELVLSGVMTPARPQLFQTVFGMIVIVLLSLAFDHSLIGVFERRESILHLCTVVMIALLVVLRKFIILPMGEASPTTLIGPSAGALAVGAVLWCLSGDGVKRLMADRPNGAG